MLKLLLEFLWSKTLSAPSFGRYSAIENNPLEGPIDLGTWKKLWINSAVEKTVLVSKLQIQIKLLLYSMSNSNLLFQWTKLKLAKWPEKDTFIAVHNRFLFVKSFKFKLIKLTRFKNHEHSWKYFKMMLQSFLWTLESFNKKSFSTQFTK